MTAFALASAGGIKVKYIVNMYWERCCIIHALASSRTVTPHL
jgi:hypothetical protein